jgi:hypothetical protein
MGSLVHLNVDYVIHICGKACNAEPLSEISRPEHTRQTMGKNYKFPRRKASLGTRKRRDDDELLALGRQFDAALAKLLSLQMRDADAIGRIEQFLRPICVPRESRFSNTRNIMSLLARLAGPSQNVFGRALRLGHELHKLKQ